MSKRSVIGLILLVAALAVFLVAVVSLHRTDPSIQLLDAAERGDLATVKSLIQQGVSINQASPTRFGWTPLIGAVFHNQTNVVQYLVESGADVNLADKKGETPLMWAIGLGDEALPLVNYLLAHGANIDAKSRYGITAFDCSRADPPRPRLIDALEAARLERSKSQK